MVPTGITSESYAELKNAAQRYQNTVENLNMLILRTEDIDTLRDKLDRVWDRLDQMQPEVDKITDCHKKLSIIEVRENNYVENSRVDKLNKELSDLRSEH